MVNLNKNKYKYISKIVLSILTYLGLGIACQDFALAADKVVHFQHWQTRNGVKVFYVPIHSLAMVDVQVLFYAGSARDSNKPGLAYLTQNMLSEGTKKLTVEDIAEQFEDVGAEVTGVTTLDSASLALRSLSKPDALNKAIDVYRQVLTQATFPEKSFHRIKRLTLRAIDAQGQQPDIIAQKALYHAIYNDAPYGHPVVGNKNSVQAIKLADIKHFYQQYYVAKNAVIVIVGDVTRKQAEAIAKKISGPLPTGVTAPKLPSQKQTAFPGKKNIPYPASQSYIRIGQVGITRSNPEYFPLIVGNHILGGGVFISRLFSNVRQKQGLAYHVSSNFNPLCTPGPFIISVETKNQSQKQALTTVFTTLNNFISQGPKAGELNAAKKNIIGSFPLLFDSNGKIMANTANLAFYDLPLDYLDTYRKKVAAVTINDIKQAFHQKIKPNLMSTIIVGK